MKNLNPRITNYPNIEVVVDNQNLLSEVEAIRKRVRATMASTLHNGQITLTLRLAEKEERAPILTGKQLLDSICEKHQTIKKLCEELHLGTV